MRTPYFAVLVLGFSLGQAFGGTEIVEKNPVVVEETPFDQGRLEYQSSSGAYFSIGGSDRPTLNYSVTNLRLGVMLNTPEGEGFFRGNFELLVQGFYASVFDGPGDYFAGASVLLRYNFVQPGARLVPYFQIGVGAAYNDIYKDMEQRLIGQAWEINLEAALGLRFFLNDRWHLNLEGGYRHLSNADMADRNTGLDSLGATAGLGYHF